MENESPFTRSALVQEEGCMPVDFQVLENQLTETEMALLMGINVALNFALQAGANADLMLTHLEQHERNFATRGERKAEHVFAALKMLAANTAGKNIRG
jgi:hypothetical protein